MTPEYKRFVYNLIDNKPLDGIHESLAEYGLDYRLPYNNKTRYPQLGTVLRICKAWNVTPNDILRGLY